MWGHTEDVKVTRLVEQQCGFNLPSDAHNHMVIWACNAIKVAGCIDNDLACEVIVNGIRNAYFLGEYDGRCSN